MWRGGGVENPEIPAPVVIYYRLMDDPYDGGRNMGVLPDGEFSNPKTAYCQLAAQWGRSPCSEQAGRVPLVSSAVTASSRGMAIGRRFPERVTTVAASLRVRAFDLPDGGAGPVCSRGGVDLRLRP
jgi:hypothetical protein